MSGVVRRMLRLVDGMSLAALRVLLSRGPRAARHVVRETVRAAGEGNRYVPFWDLARAFATEEAVVIRNGSWFDGGTSPLEQYLVALLARYFKPSLVVEVGTFRGSSTRLLLENTPADSRIITLNLPRNRDFAQIPAATDERLVRDADLGSDFRDHPERHRVTQILGDSGDDSTWRDVPDGIDFAFIDASHSYEAVRRDTEKARRKLRVEAVILWHDYTQEDSGERGVGRYIREQMRAHRDLFVVPSTTLAIRIPEKELLAADARVERFFHAGDYRRRRPGGFAPWLRL